MDEEAITLEVLPAGYGDCLLLSCWQPATRLPGGPSRRSPSRAAQPGTWRMLIDTGPDECYPSLRRRLLALPVGSNGRRRLDLFVVSHIDHDHIGGAKLLLEDRELALDFGDVWFNAPAALMPATVRASRTRGVAEGRDLASLLGADTQALNWNVAFAGRQALVPDDGFSQVEIFDPLAPRITLLSPTSARLQALERVWDRELKKLRNREHDGSADDKVAGRRRDAAMLDVESLAARVTPEDTAVPNGSSVALLVEHRGASVLLAADAFPGVLLGSLEALARSRSQARLMVDAHKLSHHGSRANVTRSLLDFVAATYYIVSTNGAIFGHPNEEALARVIASAPAASNSGASAPGKTLCFNYVTPKIQPWLEPAFAARRGFAAVVPERADVGVVIRVPARA